ncbi:spermidine synthase [Actinocorallia populi]|uniref:spermidine synthase n=1 Tax=Actinocorallia populi TaxID=2079200 RepID=UPI000D08C081|nr:spermidine synthase [Actinocorallia populi]
MSARFEELAYEPTPKGDISLRRRRDPVLGADVFEIKLDEDFLMSSLFTAGEVALAELALAQLPGERLDVVVGGLGLGYTARAVLDDPRVRSMIVVEALGEVIDWHERGLIPLGAELTADPRCRLVRGDFFAMVEAGDGFDPQDGDRSFDAVIVDIDHAPGHVLHPGHAAFYRPEGLRRLSARLRPGGVFALWSNDPPEEDFIAVLAEVFVEPHARVVAFPNHLQGGEATNTVYLARSSAA